MHRFFNIPELVLLVCGECETIYDVYHLGVTSSGLWYTVKAELWRDINDVMFRCLIPEAKSSDVSARSPFSASLQRLCALIQIVELSGGNNGLQHWVSHWNHSALPSGLEFFHDAMLFLHEGPQFPNLRRLTLFLSKPPAVQIVQNFLQHLPQSVKCLEIEFEGSDPLMDSVLLGLLLALRTIQVQLHELHIRRDYSNDDLEPLPVDLCLQFEISATTLFSEYPALRTEMRSIHLFRVHDGSRLLPVLSELPKLRKLELFLWTDREILPYNLPQKAFPCLTVALINHGTYYPQYSLFIQSLSSPNIKSVMFTTRNVEECVDVLTLLASRWAATLRSVSVVIDNMVERLEPQIAPLSDILRPLFNVQKLVELNVYHESCFSLAVDDVQRLVAGLPDLEEVELDLGYPLFPDDDRRPHTGPRVLSVLAEGLRRLKALVLNVDFDLDVGWMPSTQSVSSTAFELYLEESLTSDPDTTAALISSIFPKLKNFVCGHRKNMDRVKSILNLPN